HPHSRRNVVGLGLTDERMDEETVDSLECGFRDVLVRSMDRVSGLKPDDRLPASLGELRSRLGWGEKVGTKCSRLLWQLDNANRARHTARALSQERSDAGVLGVLGPVDALRLELDVPVESLLHGEHPEKPPIRRVQSKLVARLGFGLGGKRHGDAPGEA